MGSDSDNYLKTVINNNKASSISIDDSRLTNIKSIINTWAGTQLSNIIKSGSGAKGTAIKVISDIDLFISLKSDTAETLKELYNSLDSYVKSKGIQTKRQNVSIGIIQSGLNIDLVPGKIQSGTQNYHSIYVSKKDTWTQTNIKIHIDLINNSNRKDEIILTKIWRKNHSLDFPSIYLEVIVIEAIKNKSVGDIANNFLSVLNYLKDEFINKGIVDPANSNNTISDLLNNSEKQLIVNKAKDSLSQKYWKDIVW